MNVTMKEIAAKAGVSRSAVSKVLGNKKSVVKEETRQKILETAKKLHYQPNYFALSLKTRKTGSIGLLSSHEVNYESPEFIYHISRLSCGIQERIVETGNKYSLLSFGTNLIQTYDKSVELIRRRIVDGLVIYVMSFELEGFERSLLPVLKDMALPFVVVHSAGAELPYNNVGIDTHTAGQAAAEFLIDNGYTDCAMFINNRNAIRLREMLQGFKRGFKNKGVPWTSDHVLYRDQTDLINSEPDFKKLPKALFLPDDSLAYRTIYTAEKAGFRVPGDLAVIGFDDQKFSQLPRPWLTTFHHPIKEKGREAARMLTGILEGELDGNKVHQKLFTAEMVVRESCPEK